MSYLFTCRKLCLSMQLVVFGVQAVLNVLSRVPAEGSAGLLFPFRLVIFIQLKLPSRCFYIGAQLDWLGRHRRIVRLRG